MSPPSEALVGLIERVTFHNAEGGFCVLRVKARGQRDLVTVIGHAVSIAAGEHVQISGIWLNDRTHSLQFEAAFLKASPATTLEGIGRYLGSGIPGIHFFIGSNTEVVTIIQSCPDLYSRGCRIQPANLVSRGLTQSGTRSHQIICNFLVERFDILSDKRFSVNCEFTKVANLA